MPRWNSYYKTDRAADVMIRWSLFSILLAIMLSCASTLLAQSSYHIEPELLVEDTRPAPGATTIVALKMSPDPGWHGYWINGGAAGFALQNLRWDVPAAVQIGAPQFPVPKPKILFGMMNHVYETPYAILFPVTVPTNIAPGTPITINLSLRWLACSDKLCVPEEGQFTAYLTAGSSAAKASSITLFDVYRAALPRPLDQAGAMQRTGQSMGQRTGQRIRFAIPLPATTALSNPHLFIAEKDVVDPNAPQNFARIGNQLIVETQALPNPDGRPFPDSISGVLRLNAGVKSDDATGLAVRFAAAEVPLLSKGKPVAMDADWTVQLLLLSFGGALLGGVLLNLMPCVFPILSLKAIGIARLSGDGNAAKVVARREGWVYLAGSLLMALLLGAILLVLRAAGQEIGWAFQLQNPVSIGLLILLFALITANLLGWFELPVLAFGSDQAERHGMAGSFWTGALAAFVAAPCSGPFLGAALGAVLVLPWWGALTIFAGLGIGLALPFLLISYSESLRRRLPRPGPWMVRLRRWLAIPMALTMAGLIWLFVQNYTDDDPAQFAGRAYSSETLVTAQASGKPVFVNFTADWCISCKVNEQTSIGSDAVQSAFAKAGVRQLTADWTKGDPAITRALAAQGRNSVPLYLWYPAGSSTPEVLPQILTPDMLISRAKAAR
jgi:DsbC/DsbD-like thiol-disulfide interchange protein/cytochrome c biogenesis protein CcdA